MSFSLKFGSGSLEFNFMKIHFLIALLNILVAGLLVFSFIEAGGFRLYASVILLIVSSVYAIYFFAKSERKQIL